MEIVEILNDWKTVYDIAAETGLAASTVYQKLGVLLAKNEIKKFRRNKRTYYKSVEKIIERREKYENKQDIM
jgi:predicted transcriptional regulator